ncbi:MAG: hypothetical protein IPK67_14325 [Planctomycetes bacterium]|nr:hypothetical protein [Planctomycetota bacterium]
MTVVTEGLKELTYKQDSKSKTITASDTVVASGVQEKPKLVDQADTTARENDIPGAIGIFETCVGVAGQRRERSPCSGPCPTRSSASWTSTDP